MKRRMKMNGFKTMTDWNGNIVSIPEKKLSKIQPLCTSCTIE